MPEYRTVTHNNLSREQARKLQDEAEEDEKYKQSFVFREPDGEFTLIVVYEV